MRKDLVQTILDGLDNDLPILSDDTLAAMRLANAAPDLLEALEDAEFLLRKVGQLTGPMQDSFNRSASDARAAIAKAKA